MKTFFYLLFKRIFDVAVALIFLLLLLPLFLVIAIAIKIDSRGPVFYLQRRVGKHFKAFSMFKFRTMAPGSDKKGLLTIGNDSRITAAGKVLRRYKLDELPQLLNVLVGNMSLVGPRPEVKKYVDLYNTEQQQVLRVTPGITDLVSIRFFNESEIIARYADPEQAYIMEIIPEKLRLNLEYIQKRTLLLDLTILLKTVVRIFS